MPKRATDLFFQPRPSPFSCSKEKMQEALEFQKNYRLYEKNEENQQISLRKCRWETVTKLGIIRLR